MPEDDDVLEPEAESTQEPDFSTFSVDQWKEREAKLQRENQGLRHRLRRTEWAQEYGANVVDLVPDSLPLTEQEALAGKLAAAFASKTQDVQQTQTPPEAAEPGAQTGTVEPPEAEPTEAERNLAAVAQGSVATAASSAQTPLSVSEAADLAFRDPAAYQRMKNAGLIRPRKLPGSPQ